MPIYDFFCEKCERKLEMWLSIKESEDVKCPKCLCKMKKTFDSKMNFKLIYNPKKHKVSWGNEGYATTQRNRFSNKNG